MFEIIDKQNIAVNTIKLDIKAPDIAKSRLPGQFVLIMPTAESERAPFTIMDANIEKGTISVIIQVVGVATKRIDKLNIGESLYAVVGPLGKPTEIEKFGNVCCIGGGVGTAVMYPIAKALKNIGNKIYSIIGARSKEHLILEKEMAAVSDYFEITTDDGSIGKKGFVTDALQQLIDTNIKLDLLFAIGPAIMMKNVVLLAKRYNLKTIVSLNSIMIDGTGMCGSCRVSVNNKTKFVCVDGPEFDGVEIDWDNLILRQNAFKHQEQCALDRYLEKLR